ncbi:uncharacterized protein [Antedon mediterranea]|uniref:uncharacterized protein n=1 Tax=Antedon mediterranea TaxID=105859 RepID=UPI003AF64969
MFHKHRMQGTSFRSETKFADNQQSNNRSHSAFANQVTNSLATNRDGQQYWPRVAPTELATTSKELAMHQLVQRVKQRRTGDQNVLMGKSPMIIKAYRPPRGPYVIQQQSLMKRVMVVRPAFDDKKKGKQFRHAPPKKSIPNNTEGQIATKVTARPEQFKMKTWRPALGGEYQSHVLPSAEDRYVQNYKLQMQQAAKLLEGRYTHASDVNYALNHANPLPPIATSVDHASVDDAEDTNDNLITMDKQDSNTNMKCKDCNTKSKKKTKLILQKEKWKVVEGDAYENNLRTRHKFTNAKRQFKDDLERIRELSAIRELSYTRDDLSAQRSSRASIHSSTLLDPIQETNLMNNSENGILKTSLRISVQLPEHGTDLETENETIPKTPTENEAQFLTDNNIQLNIESSDNTEYIRTDKEIESVTHATNNETVIEKQITDNDENNKTMPQLSGLELVTEREEVDDQITHDVTYKRIVKDKSEETDNFDGGYYRFVSNDQME